MNIYPDMPAYKVTATTLSIDYNVTGAIDLFGMPLDYTSVRAAVLAYVPISNAPPNTTYAWPRRGLDLREIGPGIWKATLQWGSLNYQYATKISGNQQQIRCDKELANAFVASHANVPAAWTNGAQGIPIGWDGRTVHGASIFVPTWSWTETVEIPVSQYSFDYEDQVWQVSIAPVNDAMFRGWQTGEVIFHGMNAQLSTQNPDFVIASYEFEASMAASSGNDNLINIDTINGISKDGWDFLDVHYKQSVVSGDNVVSPQADFVLIHRVYDRGDFSQLNIGTAETLPMWGGS